MISQTVMDVKKFQNEKINSPFTKKAGIVNKTNTINLILYLDI
jgi:hypothetical protein